MVAIAVQIVLAARRHSSASRRNLDQVVRQPARHRGFRGDDAERVERWLAGHDASSARVSNAHRLDARRGVFAPDAWHGHDLPSAMSSTHGTGIEQPRALAGFRIEQQAGGGDSSSTRARSNHARWRRSRPREGTAPSAFTDRHRHSPNRLGRDMRSHAHEQFVERVGDDRRSRAARAGSRPLPSFPRRRSGDP